jgi:hypothetical protein
LVFLRRDRTVTRKSGALRKNRNKALALGTELGLGLNQNMGSNLKIKSN